MKRPPRGAAYEATIGVAQAEPCFDLPVELAVALEGGDEKREHVRIKDARTTHTLRLTARPLSVTLDKDNWILKHPNSAELTVAFPAAN